MHMYIGRDIRILWPWVHDCAWCGSAFFSQRLLAAGLWSEPVQLLILQVLTLTFTDFQVSSRYAPFFRS